MTLQNPTYIQDICYTARDDRLQMAGMLSSEGVSSFTSLRVTQQTSPAKSVEISAGHAYVNNDQDTSAGEGGYYHVYNDSPIVVTVSDNISGSTRTDYVWLKITDTAYVAGTSGASIVINQTSAPSDGSTYYRLATLAVPNGFTSIQGYPSGFGATDNQITDSRDLFSLAGRSGLIAQRIYTASGTFDKADYPGLKSVRVRVVGGGGAGGGAEATVTTPSSTGSSGAGGGAGGYAEAVLLASALGTSETVTIGAGGTGVSGATGNNGSASSFGSLVAAGGGNGGARIGANSGEGANFGGSGGTGTAPVSGGILMSGNTGAVALRLDANTLIGGTGGSSVLGAGGNGRSSNTDASQAGIAAAANTGGGGGGAANGGGPQSAVAGGNGGSGIVIVDVFA
jgi:hypothetical protein